jgi:hypothetical protein
MGEVVELELEREERERHETRDTRPSINATHRVDVVLLLDAPAHRSRTGDERGLGSSGNIRTNSGVGRLARGGRMGNALHGRSYTRTGYNRYGRGRGGTDRDGEESSKADRSQRNQDQAAAGLDSRVRQTRERPAFHYIHTQCHSSHAQQHRDADRCVRSFVRSGWTREFPPSLTPTISFLVPR